MGMSTPIKFDVLELVGIMMTEMLRTLCNDPDALTPRASEPKIYGDLVVGTLNGLIPRIGQGLQLFSECDMDELLTQIRMDPPGKTLPAKFSDAQFPIVAMLNKHPYFAADVCYGAEIDTCMPRIKEIDDFCWLANNTYYPLNGAALCFALPLDFNEKPNERIARDFFDQVYDTRWKWNCQSDPPIPMVSQFHYIHHGRRDCVNWRTGEPVRGYCIGALIWQSPMEFCEDIEAGKIVGAHYPTNADGRPL
jgi:hypothetical protein